MLIRNASIALAMSLALSACSGGGSAPADTAKGDGSAGVKAPAGGSKYEESWAGGPFILSFPSQWPVPVQCVEGDDVVCDVYRFEIPDPSIQQVLVAIAADEGYEHDDTDLYVFDDQGNQLAGFNSNDGDAFESAVVPNTGSSYYEVRVLPWLVTPGHTYTGVITEVSGQPIDVERDCLELVPQDASIAGVLDDGATVELSVLVLLDGVDEEFATQVMTRAKDSYSPLGIDLVVSGMRKVKFESQVSSDLIAEAKADTGGVPPQGADIVGLLTSKEMQSGAGDATVTVGQADCIGGIRWPENSYFVASDIRDTEDANLLGTGLNPNVEASVEVITHEIGHLMGAHHHYSNCTEGFLATTGPTDVSPCTLMFPAVNFASMNFSTVSGAVVRGHAVQHAAP